MKLGTRGRYAVMAMVDLAKFSQKKPISLASISERQEISLSYLEQLFSCLRQAKLIKSIRGAAGGYLLSRPADQVTIADIVLAVDEPIRATRCLPNTGGCLSNSSRCLVHELWEELGNQIHLFLRAVTLKDVCDRNIIGKQQIYLPLCTEPSSMDQGKKGVS